MSEGRPWWFVKKKRPFRGQRSIPACSSDEPPGDEVFFKEEKALFCMCWGCFPSSRVLHVSLEEKTRWLRIFHLVAFVARISDCRVVVLGTLAWQAYRDIGVVGWQSLGMGSSSVCFSRRVAPGDEATLHDDTVVDGAGPGASNGGGNVLGGGRHFDGWGLVVFWLESLEGYSIAVGKWSCSCGWGEGKIQELLKWELSWDFILGRRRRRGHFFEEEDIHPRLLLPKLSLSVAFFDCMHHLGARMTESRWHIVSSSDQGPWRIRIVIRYITLTGVS